MIYVVRLLLIYLYTLLWGTVACLSVFVDRSGETVVWVARQWVGWILRTCGIEVRAEGLEHIDPDQPYVFMSNHQSLFDVGGIVVTLPVSWRFVAKRELVWIPFFGWALALGGHVIVDRGNRARAVASLEAAAEQIRQGTNVIVFPEGTRRQTGELGPFKSGGFHLAIGAGVPIVPVSVSGSQHVTPGNGLRVEPGRILIRYGEPIPTGDFGLGEREALKERVREAIRAGILPDYGAPDGASELPAHPGAAGRAR